MGKDDDLGRPEELINRYVRLVTATANITSGLGTLALLWSTVVLLGGFVSTLKIKEFWVLTGLSFLMAFRVVENFENEVKRGIYLEEANIITFVGRQKWIPVWSAIYQMAFVSMVLLLKVILIMCLLVLSNLMPYASLGIPLWRLVRRDYGDAGGDVANKAKLNAALDIFYALVLFQTLFFLYWIALESMLYSSVVHVAQATSKQCGHEKWSSKLVVKYCSETRRKFKKDGELPDGWDLIRYGLELLRSTSGNDEHSWGARVLDKLFDEADKTVRRELLSSRLSIQNLIGMVGRSGAADDDIENRERAARIVAHLANDLHITSFPCTLQCICSLLESYYKPQVHSPQSILYEQTLSYKNHLVPAIIDQTDEEQAVVSSPSARLANGKTTTFIQRLFNGRGQVKKFKQEVKGYSETKYRHLYKSIGAKELISQSFQILERLTNDEGNCTEISKDQRLLSIITAPLRSHDFLSKLQDNMMVQVQSMSLRVLSRLLISPGDGATRLHQDLASNTEAVSNLMVILETDSEGAQQLHGQAVEILTELALTSFTNPAFGESAFMLNKICENLEILAEEKDGSNIAVEPDRENALRLSRVRAKAGDALQRLLPFQAARIVKATAKVSKKHAIDRLTKLVDRTLSGKIGTITEAATWASSSNSCAIQKVGSQPLQEDDNVQPPTEGHGEQSEERDVSVTSKQAFMEDMLFVAAAMRVVNVIDEQDFTRPSPEDEALVKKLMEILEVNMRSTAEFFKTLKVSCQVVVPMIQAVPSSIKYLNEQNVLKETLTEILETMNARELPEFKIGRVKEMKERLS